MPWTRFRLVRYQWPVQTSNRNKHGSCARVSSLPPPRHAPHPNPDLPPEILVEPHPAEFYRASYLLCLQWRRLGCRHRGSVGAYRGRSDAMSALQICPSISSLKCLEFIFPHPTSGDILPFLKQMTRVKALISRLPSVKDVCHPQSR